MPGLVLQHQDILSDLEIEADAIVIGSGAGGAVMASELAEGGLRVLILEEGSYHSTSEISPDPGAMVKQFYRDAGTAMILGKPNIIFAEGRCVGGSTVINGGMCWRTPERILKKWYLELGLTGIDAKSVEPYFEKVERRIHVSTQDPDTISAHDYALKRGADALGYKVSWNTRNQLHCMGTNNCAFGCPTGGKQSMLVSYLPNALSHGATLIANARVNEFLRRGDRIEGIKADVIVPTANNRKAKIIARAPITILSAGATQSPCLLIRQGLARSLKQIGRNFTCHPNAKIVAIMDEPIFGWKGVHQAFQVHEFLDEGLIFAAVYIPPSILTMSMPFIGDEMYEFISQMNHMVIAGCLAEDATVGTIRPGPFGSTLMRYDIDPVTFQRVLRGTSLLCEMFFEAGARKIYLPIHGMQALNSPDDIHSIFQRNLKPTDIELMTVHAMSTCRMARSKSEGVVDSFGRLFDLKGLHIADGSIVPTPIGLNPQETIMMLSTRQADHILNDWQKIRSLQI